MNKKDLAEKDYQMLQKMNPKLVDELSYVIDKDKEKEPEQFLDVSKKIK